MDQINSGIDTDPKTLCIDVPKSNEPIITFSPDKCRFDPGGFKSRNSSIASDFEINSTLELDYSSEGNPSKPSTSLMTDLLTNPVGGHSAASGTTSSASTTTNTTTLLNNNVNGSSSSTSGPSSSRSQQRVRNSSTTSSNSNRNPNATTSSELHKRLEKQIAQASSSSATVVVGGGGINSSQEETEFGEWSSTPHQTVITKSTLKSNNNNNGDLRDDKRGGGEHKDLSSAGGCLKSKEEAGEQVHQDRKRSTCVKFYQEDEVEIITKSSSGRMSGKGFGGLIPPERLAIPNKGHSNRKHSSKGDRQTDSSMRISVINAPQSVPQPLSPLVNQNSHHDDNMSNPTGTTSEIKPLVQWNSDESEDELSFFPTMSGQKPRAKLTDNLSIDNMSLSGEEDDLHLSPPTHLKQKCPCDPRVWINDHLPKTPPSFSSHRESGQCIIA